MPRTLFWDVDTQIDFVDPTGALYAPGAETIVPALERLTAHARRMGLHVGGSIDFHSMEDPEISLAPDRRTTWPPHCIAGTPGVAKIPATAPRNPLWIASNPVAAPALAAQVRAHAGEVILQKQSVDVFSNPNVCTVLRAIAPERIVVYGVYTDVCDRYAVEGFLLLGNFEVWFVEDAAWAIDPDAAPGLLARWRDAGVRIVTTDEVLAETR